MKVALWIIKLVVAVVQWASRRHLIRTGEKLAIARELRRLAVMTDVARTVEGEVAIMTDDEIMLAADEEGWFYD